VTQPRPGPSKRASCPRSVMLMGLSAALTLAACSGGKSHVTGGAAQAPTTAAPAGVAPTTGPAPAASVAPRSSSLASVALPAPDGYVTSTSPDANNGPITPAQFDQLTNGKGTASSLGFTNGYEVTYDSTDPNSSDYIDISVGTFSTDAAAKNIVSVFIASFLASNADQSPAQHPYQGIAGAIELDGAKLGSDGFLDRVVVAARGPAIMAIDFVADNSGPPPAAFTAWVASQYARL
jgi:hypothetical protein